MKCGGQPWVWVDTGTFSTTDDASERENNDSRLRLKFEFPVGPSSDDVQHQLDNWSGA